MQRALRRYRSAAVRRASTRLADLVDHATVGERVAASQPVLERLLVENVIPFELRRADWGSAGDLQGYVTRNLRLHISIADARYGHCYPRTLDWITEHQADWEHRDWHERVDRRGRPVGLKAAWKEPYHQGRALLECLDAFGTCEAPQSVTT